MQKQDFRYYISKSSVYILLFCVLFLVQRGLLLLVLDLHKCIIFGKVYLYEIIISITTILILVKFIKIKNIE